MSGIAKGKIVVSEVELKKWLGLSDDTEIVSALHLEDGIELKIASKEPNKFTRDTKNWNNIRRVKLPEIKGISHYQVDDDNFKKNIAYHQIND